MSFNPFNIDLPVTEIIPLVRNHLEIENTLMVNAPPGAGKSTLLPLALIDEIWLRNKKIIILEPRRLAAKSIASRMAYLFDEEVGNTIGYRIRFENRVSQNTKIEVVTEGILTRMLHTDNALEDVGLVVFDEFHERSLHADLALALCRETQQILRPDLRIIIMSATLNMPQLNKLLNAPVVESKGKQFPVDVIYTSDADDKLLPELTARIVFQAINDYMGDVLVFLPGEAEIRKCEALLNLQLAEFCIHPLYGQLAPKEQHLAIMPNKLGKRKIVLATSIAETSLTIEGITIVVDCGFTKIARFDNKSGLSRLETVRVSKDSADQRAGRAGRLEKGVCYRMWTNATHERLAEHRVPEILEADLAPLLLDLAVWGVNNPEALTWLTPPPNVSVIQANQTLHQLNALSDNKITEHGKRMHRLACHPRIANMLLMAFEIKTKMLATDIAAILEERDPLGREIGVDLNLRIEALRRSRINNSLNRFNRIEKVAASYRKLLHVDVDNGFVDVFETGILLAYAYPERIAFARPGNNSQYQLANGKYAMISYKDDLAHEPWLAIAHMDLREGIGKIFLAAPLNPKDLLPLVKEQEIIIWDIRKGGIIGNKELKIGSLILQSKPITDIPEEKRIKAICYAIKTEGEQLLNFDDDMQQLQCRIISLGIWNNFDNWPNANTKFLLETCKLWLVPYLSDIKKNEDLKKLKLSEVFFHSLNYEVQAIINELAPKKINVPSGSMINIHYFINGASPIISVRLQEVFGLKDTPVINNGKIKVVMHLLSPGYKPVQVTTDLTSFWTNLYFEVKKELQRRYPKHSWPDDPLLAVPVAKGKTYKKN